MWTEWNVPSFGPLKARDTSYVGAALADDIRQCDGLVDMLSFWTFSDVFEEGGPKSEPFDGGFGLMAMGGIRKPSYSGFALLHKLGEERIANDSRHALVTRRKNGTLVIAAWNAVDLDKTGAPLTLEFQIQRRRPNNSVSITRVDSEHANSLAAYKTMGSPRYPSRVQVAEMNRAAVLPEAEKRNLKSGSIVLTVPVNGLLLVEIPQK